MRTFCLIFSLFFWVACGDSTNPSGDTTGADKTTSSDVDVVSDTEPVTDSVEDAHVDAEFYQGCDGIPVFSDLDAESETDTDTTATIQCPPEGSEILGNPPPDNIPAGSCEPQPVSEIPPVITGTVAGTEHPSEFIYQVPPNPKGLILIFHGGGGSKEDAYARIEVSFFFKEAVLAGYAVAALDSAAHLDPPEDGKFKWDIIESPCNPDIINVVAMIKQLKDPNDLGVIPPNAPLYALGISNGGSMVSRTAQHIDFAAVATYITNAQQFHDPGAKIPPVFIMAASNDTTVEITGPCLLYGLAIEQGIDVVFKYNVPQAITPGLFTRIPEISCEESVAILESFRQNDVVAEGTDILSTTPDDISSWKPFLTETTVEHQADIRDLLLERYGAHAFTSDFIADTLKFFDEHVTPSSPMDLPICE